MHLRDILRKKLIKDMVKAVQPASKWKILIVDGRGLRILNSTCKAMEILEDNVTAIEDLNKKRQPYSSLEAIYFISATESSLNKIIDDFPSNKPTYAAAHIFFVSTLDDNLFDKLKKSSAAPFIRSVKEMNVDFIAFEQQVFTLEQPLSPFHLYNPESTSAQLTELNRISKRLISFLATIEENPYIRYFNPSEGNVKLAEKMAKILQNDMNTYGELDPDFEALKTKRRATLVIVDRSFDMISPLMHEFTYQAMMNDLLSIEGGKYIFKSEGSASTAENGQVKNFVNLDETDAIMCLLRHWHFSEAVDYIRSNFNKFLQENKAAASALGLQDGKTDNLKLMKDTIGALPQFQEMKAKYSIHINVCQECKALFEKRKLDAIASFEQDIATGLTVDGKPPRNAMIDLVPLLLDTALLSYDKIRMLMIYIIAFEGIQDMERRRLLENAKLSIEETQSINNLGIMGVKLNNPNSTKKESGRYSYWGSHSLDSKKRVEGKEIYDLSRYVPLIKRVMDDISHNDLQKAQFPWVNEPSSEVQNATAAQATRATNRGNKDVLVATDGSHPFSLRTTRPRWIKQADNNSKKEEQKGEIEEKTAYSTKSGPPVIIFILGGLTFSEMRCTYEASKEYNRDIIIGSTAICNPTQMVDILKEIHKPDPLSTKVGAAMASNTALYSGDMGILTQDTSEGKTKSDSMNLKSSVDIEKPEKKGGFFSRKK